MTKEQFKKLWNESGINEACEANTDNPEAQVVDHGMSPQLKAHLLNCIEKHADSVVDSDKKLLGIEHDPSSDNVKNNRSPKDAAQPKN